MIGKYQLSKSNKTFFLVIATLYSLRYLIFIPKNAESLGYLLGTVVSFFLFAILISLLVWFLTKQNNKYGSIAFNIMLSLTLLSQLSKVINSITEIN